MALNLRGRFVWRHELRAEPGTIPMWYMGYDFVPSAQDHLGACREAFATVRREVWSYREAALRGQEWEGYG